MNFTGIRVMEKRMKKLIARSAEIFTISKFPAIF
jgi:hypothetical protein